MALTKASSMPAALAASFKFDELVAQKLLPGVGDRAGAGWAQRGGARRAQAGVGVEFSELALLPAHADDAHRRAGRSGIGRNGLRRSRREAGEAVEDVIAPSAAVGGRAHGLAELAVVGNVDAGAFLRQHDLADGGAQPRLQRRFVLSRDGFFRPHGAQVRRPRQAADVGGENAFSASFHGRCLAVVYPQIWRKIPAEETVMFPAIKPLRDLDHFAQATYPIDAKLLDGQGQTFKTWLFCKSAATAATMGLRRRDAVRNSCVKMPNLRKASNSALTNCGKVAPSMSS